jgi:triphosphatase
MNSLSADAPEDQPAGGAEATPTEIELKLRIPQASAQAVRRAVATASAQRVRLQARYFDTADRRLAAAGIALRLRREDGHWVQTLKSRGDGLLVRGEHEVRLGRSRAAPPLDVTRHRGTAAGAALREALGKHSPVLEEVFATDIRRTTRQVRATGAVVELALDEGEIRAGHAHLRVRELELELVRGSPHALAALAQRWVRQHGLWLDPRSKAERGERLARGAQVLPAVHARAPLLDPAMDAAQALRAMLASGLTQVLANACELVDGSGTPEHLHQCRVGLRRLRSALRDFAPLAGAEAPPDLQRWDAELRALLVPLGRARDRDALAHGLLPQLAAAGAALDTLPPAREEPVDPGVLLRTRGANTLWLEILACVHAPPAPADTDAPAIAAAVRRRLAKLHRQVARDAAHFEQLDEAAQHRVRKRLKRLRYGTEFCAALFDDDAVARYLRALKPAQDALGAAQDLAVARALFEPLAASDPRAAFVLGWIAARRPQLVAQSAETLRAVADAPRFWRGARAR